MPTVLLLNCGSGLMVFLARVRVLVPKLLGSAAAVVAKPLGPVARFQISAMLLQLGHLGRAKLWDVCLCLPASRAGTRVYRACIGAPASLTLTLLNPSC